MFQSKNFTLNTLKKLKTSPLCQKTSFSNF